MTIRLSHELSRDLRRRDGWPNFRLSASAASSRVELYASTFTWESDTDDKVVLNQHATIGTAYRVAALAQELELVTCMYLVTGTLQPNSAVVRHRKIWGSVSVTSIPSSIQKWPETIAECGSRIRIATMAKVPSEGVQWMLRLSETFDIVVPLLLPAAFAVDNGLPEELLRIAYPPDGCRNTSDFEWASFAEAIATKNGVCIRRTNEYSDRRILVDFFAANELADRIAEIAGQRDQLKLAQPQ
jgi:hypothetical protein